MAHENIIDDLLDDLKPLRFGAPVTHVYNPLVYARKPYSQYCEQYGTPVKEIVLVGMNPGPWGMAQTGIPFGEITAVKEWLHKAEHTGPLLIMGRSLGSAAAIELASCHSEDIAGIIIESGFATSLPLLMKLGVDVAGLGITENDGFRNVRKISTFTKPTLIIHGQYDEIIPVNSAAILQSESPARSKELQVVPGATHNTLIAQAGEMYFSVIKQFINKICGIRAKRRKK